MQHQPSLSALIVALLFWLAWAGASLTLVFLLIRALLKYIGS